MNIIHRKISKGYERIKKQLKKASAYGHKRIQKYEIYWNVDVQYYPGQ